MTKIAKTNRQSHLQPSGSGTRTARVPASASLTREPSLLSVAATRNVRTSAFGPVAAVSGTQVNTCRKHNHVSGTANSEKCPVLPWLGSRPSGEMGTVPHQLPYPIQFLIE